MKTKIFSKEKHGENKIIPDYVNRRVLIDKVFGFSVLTDFPQLAPFLQR